MVAMAMVAMVATVAMEWISIQKVKMKTAGTVVWMTKKKKATIQLEMKLQKMPDSSESTDQDGLEDMVDMAMVDIMEEKVEKEAKKKKVKVKKKKKKPKEKPKKKEVKKLLQQKLMQVACLQNLTHLKPQPKFQHQKKKKKRKEKLILTVMMKVMTNKKNLLLMMKWTLKQRKILLKRENKVKLQKNLKK